MQIAQLICVTAQMITSTMNNMTLEDISDYSHSERTRLFLLSLTGKTATSNNLTTDDLAIAVSAATTEMLDEIHCMLRSLTIKK